MQNKEYLFVYGTLRKAFNHPLYHFLSRHAELVGIGTFRGKLYDLGPYPAAVPSEKPSDKVIGEVYELRGTKRLFGLLDEYEGPRFWRRKAPIMLWGGRKVISWLYLYRRETTGLKPIVSGDYVRFRQSKAGNSF